MAQADFNIANQTFPDTRADMNNQLAALASLSSGDTLPANPVDGMLAWHTNQSGAHILKTYHVDEDDWVNLINFDITSRVATFIGAVTKDMLNAIGMLGELALQGSATNYNTLTTGGHYYVPATDAVNGPGFYAILTVLAADADNVVQVAEQLDADVKKERKCVDGVWSVWVDVPTATALDTLKSIPGVSVTAARSLALTDAGQSLNTAVDITIPADSAVALPPGFTCLITNITSGPLNIVQGSGVTLHQAGSANTGNRVLPLWGVATVRKISANTFIVAGAS